MSLPCISLRRRSSALRISRWHGALISRCPSPLWNGSPNPRNRGHAAMRIDNGREQIDLMYRMLPCAASDLPARCVDGSSAACYYRGTSAMADGPWTT